MSSRASLLETVVKPKKKKHQHIYIEAADVVKVN